MMTIGDRLREERDRLGLNQTEFAAIAGHSRSAQASYERNDKTPGGAYLAMLAKAGIDIVYVLTGERALTLAEVETHSQEEKKLIENYRALDDAQRLNVQAVSDAFASAQKIGRDAAND